MKKVEIEDNERFGASYLIGYKKPVNDDIHLGLLNFSRAPGENPVRFPLNAFRKAMERFAKRQYGKDIELVFVGQNMLQWLPKSKRFY